MNIYFGCSITGGREFEPVYQAIVRALEAVVPPQEVHTRDVAWIGDCDVLIAEVRMPSHGVGYEIAFALG